MDQFRPGLAAVAPADACPAPILAILQREQQRPKILDRLHSGLCVSGPGLEQIPGAGTLNRALPGADAIEDQVPPSPAASPASADANASWRLRLMKSTPNTRSASYWLCALHLSRRFSTIAFPPRA